LRTFGFARVHVVINHVINDAKLSKRTSLGEFSKESAISRDFALISCWVIVASGLIIGRAAKRFSGIEGDEGNESWA
jgi:hypothetical protein